MSLAPEALRRAYVDACFAELLAFKPGNVSVYSAGHDMTVADFRASAQASAGPLCDPGLALGERIFRAVAATREAVGCNTNLGIVLLAAPLLEACMRDWPRNSLREKLRAVLASTTRADADWVYQAIRRAAPGGLGKAEAQDVSSAPTVTLFQAMDIAAGRDRIAWQYVNCYADVFDLAIPRYYKGMSAWGDEAWAAAAVFAELLKTVPDSHIERKFGGGHNRLVAETMTRIASALSAAAEPGQTLPLLRQADAGFKAAGINPGTSADLTVACLLAVRLDRLLGLRPRPAGLLPK